MQVAQARRHHQLKHASENDARLLADRRVNPTFNAVNALRKRWMGENHGSFDDSSVLASLERLKRKMPQHLIEVSETSDGYVAALVTDFMYRIHKELKSASEVVFVDTTSRHVEKINCSITLLFCSSSAGVLPLGVILSSNQTKEDYVTGMPLTSIAILNQRSFFFH